MPAPHKINVSVLMLAYEYPEKIAVLASDRHLGMWFMLSNLYSGSKRYVVAANSK
jgi:hypothetical protein